jgi:hypothetical protein
VIHLYYKAFLMAYTGVDLYNDLKVRTNQGQAGAFLNIDRANYIVNSAIINQFEKVVSQLAIQRNTDEVSPCIKRDVSFTPNNSQVLLKPLIITSVRSFTTTTYLVFFDRPHNLVAGTPINISGVTGATSGVNNVNQPTSVYTNYIVNDDRNITITVASAPSGGASSNIGTGKAISSGYIIDDYYHLLAVQYNFNQVLNIDVISLLKNTSLSIITISANNNIRSGEYLNFTNFSGVTIGLKYVKKIAYNKIQLYNDADLTTPTILTGNYVSGGTITRSNGRYADPLNPDQKVDVYRSSFYYPLYQSSDNNLSIVVYDKHKRVDTSITPTSFVVDYVRTFPPIDLEDSIYDIHQDFNAKFCDKIIEYAALKFQAFTSAGEDAQLTEIIGGAR